MCENPLHMAHVFVSYLRDDSALVDRLCAELRLAGIDVWLDRDRLQPGQRWRSAIRTAIQSGACFIACFSSAYAERAHTYMNEELAVAIEELRTRPSDRTWFIPVLLTAADLPDLEIGVGETIRDLQWADLTSDWERGLLTLVRSARASETITERITLTEIARARELAASADSLAQDVITVPPIPTVTDDEAKLIERLFQYKGRCMISAVSGEHESVWVPSFMTEMQWGWERTAQYAQEAGKPIGDRVERLRWIFVVRDLVAKGFLFERLESHSRRTSHYELTELGWRTGLVLAQERT
jgi:hypothetical protein